MRVVNQVPVAKSRITVVNPGLGERHGNGLAAGGGQISTDDSNFTAQTLAVGAIGVPEPTRWSAVNALNCPEVAEIKAAFAGAYPLAALTAASAGMPMAFEAVGWLRDSS